MAEQNPTPEGQGERTFTQAEVDEIVRTRLDREKKKYGDYDSLKQEIADMKKAATVEKVRAKVAGEKGVPVALLTGEDEESCNKQADELLKFKGDGKDTSYPEPKKNDGKKKHEYKGENAEEWREFANNLFGGN